MITKKRKTISQNPLDEIPTGVRPAAKGARVVKKSTTAIKAMRAAKTGQATRAPKNTDAPTRSAEKVEQIASPVKAARRKPSIGKASAKKQIPPDVQDTTPIRMQTAEQLLSEELSPASALTANRDEEIIGHPCTPIKVLEAPDVVSSATGSRALSGQYLTAEDIFQSELSRARVLVKAEATQTRLAAQKIVSWWSRWSVAVSFIPVPFVDMAAISGVQVKMIYELCKKYEVDFEHKAAVAIASGVAGGAAVQTMAGVVAKQMVRFAPGVGPVFMFAVEPTISYVTTKAIGLAFINHFEADGRMHDFNPERVRHYMAELVKKRQFTSKEKIKSEQA
jgi:uncharacterized protein (DUF697 family)